MTCAMSQPYEFFPGSTPDPAAAFGQPVPPRGVGAAPVVSPAAPARPGIVSVLAGLLVAQAALAGGPAVALLLMHDTIAAVVNSLTSTIGGADELTGVHTTTAGLSGSGRLTLWGLALLLVTVLSALSAVAVLDRRGWGLAVAGIAEVSLCAWSLTHFGSLPTVSSLGVLLALAIVGLLALPDVRRWCPIG
jgi:hypothetical protein